MSAAEVRTAGPSSAFLAAGAFVAGIYVAAQLFQEFIIGFVLPETPDAAAEIVARLLVVDRARQVIVLASLFLVPVAYAGLALARWRQAPGAVVVGLVFGVMFAALESAYRSINLFVGSQWAAEFVTTTDAALRTVLLERFDSLEAGIIALYLPLLAAHGLSSAAFSFAIAAGKRRDWWDRVLVFALAANALRALLRILQMHAGVAWLGQVNMAIYLPVTLLTYGMLAAWLARASVEQRNG